MVEITKDIKVEQGGNTVEFNPETMSEIADIVETMSDRADANDQDIFVEIKGTDFNVSIDVSRAISIPVPPNPYDFWQKVLGWAIVAIVMIVIFGT